MREKHLGRGDLRNVFLHSLLPRVHRAATQVLALLLSSCAGYLPRSVYQESLTRSAGPDFSLQAFTYHDEGKMRSDVYVALSNKALQFRKEGDAFLASYTIALRVAPAESRDVPKRPQDLKDFVAEANWTEKVMENTYEGTVGRAYHVSPRSFNLAAGMYAIFAQVTDDVSSRTAQTTRMLAIPDYTTRFLALSNIAIGSRFVMKSGRRTLVPNVISEMSTTGDPLYAQFEVYDRFPGRDITLQTSIVRTRNYKPPSFLSRYHQTEQVKALPDTVISSYDSTITTTSEEILIDFSLPDLPTGHYRIDITARAADAAAMGGQREWKAIQHFTVWPFGFPEIVTLDQQIEVLEYIASSKEFEKLKQAETKQEKEQELREFWSSRENREEYYQRAEYANRHFTCIIEGWRTQFGWVYMVAGPPLDVQSAAQGVERWRYSLGSSRVLTIPFITREFSFPDAKCRYGAAYIEPTMHTYLTSLWRKIR